MHTAHLPTICIFVATTRFQHHGVEWLGPQVNKFEQVSGRKNRGTGRYSGPMSRGRGFLCIIGNAHMGTFPLPHGQTDACENITFPQLSLRKVITRFATPLHSRLIECIRRKNNKFTQILVFLLFTSDTLNVSSCRQHSAI